MLKPGHVVPEIEELLKLAKIQHTNTQDCLQAFLNYVDLHDRCNNEWSKKENDLLEQIKALTKEKDRQVKSLMKEKESLEGKLRAARRLIDETRLQRKRAEDERLKMESQLQDIRNLLQDNRNKLHDETREKLQFLSTFDQKLNTINESLYCDTTGSILSDMSYSRSEDDMLELDSIRFNRKLRRSRGIAAGSDDQGMTTAKRGRLSTGRSEIIKAGPGECLVTTTRVDMGNGRAPIASSVIETFPSSGASSIPALQPTKPSAPQMTTESESDEIQVKNNNFHTPRIDRTISNTALQSPSGNGFFPFGINMMNTRTHSLSNKTVIRPENCDLCGKKIKFSKVALKCDNCRTLCHVECKGKLKLPCIPPGSGTPTGKDAFGTIADYAPPTTPMIPAIVFHCVSEIEEKGLSEVGLYRIPGSDKEVKALRDKFLKGRGVPNLSLVNDIHTITGCLKEFLRSLKEPLLTFSHRPQFVEAVQINDLEARRAALFHCFTKLPQPNRDTLAYLILHLQRIAEVPEIRMPICSLAKIFGPTAVGYSKGDSEMINEMFKENQDSVQVMEALLSIPSEYWKNSLSHNTPSMPCTPSTGSLREQCKFFETPSTPAWVTVRKKKH